MPRKFRCRGKVATHVVVPFLAMSSSWNAGLVSIVALVESKQKFLKKDVELSFQAAVRLVTKVKLLGEDRHGPRGLRSPRYTF